MNDSIRDAIESRTITVRLPVHPSLGTLSETDMRILALHVRRGAQMGMRDGIAEMQYARTWEGEPSNERVVTVKQKHLTECYLIQYPDDNQGHCTCNDWSPEV